MDIYTQQGMKPADAATYLGLGRTKFYELLKTGEIPSGWVGKTRLVRRVDLDRFLARLVGASASPEATPGDQS